MMKPPPATEEVHAANALRMRGTVVAECAAGPVSGVRVQAWDHDHARDDFLGEATTDAAGAFELALDPSQ